MIFILLLLKASVGSLAQNPNHPQNLNMQLQEIDIANFHIQFWFRFDVVGDQISFFKIDCFNRFEENKVRVLEIMANNHSLSILAKNSTENQDETLFQDILKFQIWCKIVIESSKGQMTIDSLILTQSWISNMVIQNSDQCFTRIGSLIGQYSKIQIVQYLLDKQIDCVPGCEICMQQDEHKCIACEKLNIINSLFKYCQYFKDTSIRLQDLYQSSQQTQQLIRLVDHKKQIELIKTYKIFVRDNFYEYNHYQFMHCYELLNEQIISELLDLMITKIIINIEYNNQILSFDCSSSVIPVLFELYQIYSINQSEPYFNRVSLVALQVSIDSNNNVIPNQIIEIQSYDVSLRNAYITQNTSTSIFTLFLNQTIKLNLFNISIYDVDINTLNFIILQSNNQASINITKFRIRQSIFHHFNLIICISRVVIDKLAINNFKIEHNQLVDFHLTTFEIETLVITNLSIESSLLENCTILQTFRNLNSQNLSIITSRLVTTNVIMNLIFTRLIKLQHTYISGSSFQNSQVLLVFTDTQSTNLFIQDFIMFDLQIECESQFTVIQLSRIYEVSIINIYIYNVRITAQLMIFQSLDYLTISDLSIQNAIFTTSSTNEFGLYFINILNLETNHLHFKNLSSQSYLIEIISSEISNLRILNFSMIEIDAYEFISIMYTSNSTVRLSNINFSMIWPMTINSQNQDVMPILKIIAQSVSIFQAQMALMQGSIKISSQIVHILRSKFTNNLMYSNLQISSHLIIFKSNILHNFCMHFDQLELYSGYLRIIDNQIITQLQTNYQGLYLLGITNLNVQIMNNTMQFMDEGSLIAIFVDQHDIYLLNNTFIYAGKIIIGNFSNNTLFEMNKTIIYQIQKNELIDLIQCHECYHIIISSGKTVLIDNLFINRTSCSLLAIQSVHSITIQNIYVQNIETIHVYIVIHFSSHIIIRNTTIQDLKQIVCSDQSVNNLINIMSNKKQEILIEWLSIHKVTAWNLIQIASIQEQIITIRGLRQINNNCWLCCIFLSQPRGQYTQFLLIDFLSVLNIATSGIFINLGLSSELLFENILINNKDQNFAIIRGSDFCTYVVNVQFYQQFTTENGVVSFQRIDLRFQNHLRRLSVSFNAAVTYQNSVIQQNTSIAIVQFRNHDGRSQNYCYIPPYGYSFNNYSIFKPQSLTYEAYHLNIRFLVRTFYQDYVVTRCVLILNGSQQINFDYDSQNFSDFTVNYYEGYQIQFNTTCYSDDTLSLIFYAKQLKCQIGEINLTNLCVPCTKELDQYSLQNTDRLCKTRDAYSMKSTQMSLIDIRRGFWRSEFYTDRIESCITWQDSCNGGFLFGDQSCKIGYIGASCFECDTQNQFYRQINGSCGKSYYLIIYLLIWILMYYYSIILDLQQQ